MIFKQVPEIIDVSIARAKEMRFVDHGIFESDGEVSFLPDEDRDDG